jgi:hypothetical protein
MPLQHMQNLVKQIEVLYMLPEKKFKSMSIFYLSFTFNVWALVNFVFQQSLLLGMIVTSLNPFHIPTAYFTLDPL